MPARLSSIFCAVIALAALAPSAHASGGASTAARFVPPAVHAADAEEPAESAHESREMGVVGFYYFRLRYLDPEQGRFVNRDPLGIWGDPGQFGNAYSFAGNDPVNRVDPWGLRDAPGVGPNDGWGSRADYHSRLEARDAGLRLLNAGGGRSVAGDILRGSATAVLIDIPTGLVNAPRAVLTDQWNFMKGHKDELLAAGIFAPVVIGLRNFYTYVIIPPNQAAADAYIAGKSGDTVEAARQGTHALLGYAGQVAGGVALAETTAGTAVLAAPSKGRAFNVRGTIMGDGPVITPQQLAALEADVATLAQRHGLGPRLRGSGVNPFDADVGGNYPGAGIEIDAGIMFTGSQLPGAPAAIRTSWDTLTQAQRIEAVLIHEAQELILRESACPPPNPHVSAVAAGTQGFTNVDPAVEAFLNLRITEGW